MGRIQLVVTDLDGTLWDHDNWHASQDTKLALKALEAAGIPVVAATARSSRGTSSVLSQNAIELSAAVVLNGALGIDYRNNTRFHETTFSCQETRRVIHLFLQEGIEPCLYLETDDKSVVTSTKASSAREYLSFVGDAMTYVDDLTEYFNGKVAFSAMAVGIDRVPAKAIADALTDVADARLIPDLRWGGWTIAVVPPKINKWEGIASFCHQNNIPTDSILAIGDGDIDVDFLENALIPCAMSHATPSALAASHVIVDTWSGILDFIDLG